MGGVNVGVVCVVDKLSKSVLCYFYLGPGISLGSYWDGTSDSTTVAKRLLDV